MRVLVLGAGVGGGAVARLLRRLHHEALVYDESPTALAELRELEFEVHNGTWAPRRLHGVDLVVVSPGFRPDHPALVDAAALGVPVVGELEFAARHIEVPMVAVTGTNGKTTVTDLIAAMLRAGGVRAAAAGNIGVALSDLAGTGPAESPDIIVVETSSFQLHYIDRFRADVAVILNVAPDHLDWHGSMAAYAAAKARIHENQTADDLVVFNAGDDGAASIAAGAPGRLIPVRGDRRDPAGFGPEYDKLFLGEVAVPIPDRLVGDAAYLSNLAAAGAAALDLGGSADAVAEVVAGFEPGPHRRAAVGTWDGVTWVNDSKATNPHAAVAAAGAYPSVVLIAGGRNKGLDLSPMAAVPTVRRYVLIGEAAGELARLLPADRVMLADTLEEAVATASQVAETGDTVLLAPGCASFDMFEDYRQRGDAFTAAARARNADRR